MNKALPDPPHDHRAFHRAIDRHSPTKDFHCVNEDLSFEDALLYTASLLDSASVTALDCSEHLESPSGRRFWRCGIYWRLPGPRWIALSTA